MSGGTVVPGGTVLPLLFNFILPFRVLMVVVMPRPLVACSVDFYCYVLVYGGHISGGGRKGWREDIYWFKTWDPLTPLQWKP